MKRIALVVVGAVTMSAGAASAQTRQSVADQKQARYEIAQMERVLEGAVEHGVANIRDRLQAVGPTELLISDNARARGFRLDGYGVFFDVVVPSLRASAVTVTLLIAHLFGDSYAAAAVGLLSDALGGLQIALLIVSPILLLVAAALAMLALGSIQSDVAAMDQLWTDRSSSPADAVPI